MRWQTVEWRKDRKQAANAQACRNQHRYPRLRAAKYPNASDSRNQTESKEGNSVAGTPSNAFKDCVTSPDTRKDQRSNTHNDW